MLTEVKAYSSWQSAPELLLDGNGRAETDFIQIRNIDGLDPVKASVNTSPFGAIDGSSYTGSSVLSRNIVLTVRPNPNWANWTYESLRRLLYSYFMPKRPTRLVFYSDDMIPVAIEGIVESVEVNPFSNDPELLISVICPDPYFVALDPIVVTGQSIRAGGTVTEIDYNGTIESGIYVQVTHVSTPAPTTIQIQIGDPEISYFIVDASVGPSLYFEMSSVPMQKYVQNVNMSTGVITNLLSKVHIIEGSSWPTILQPGLNEFSVITNQGVQDWELRYFERFGGL
jgi:Phage tail protein RIFT-related domain